VTLGGADALQGDASVTTVGCPARVSEHTLLAMCATLKLKANRRQELFLAQQEKKIYKLVR
jgi:hypothetical protein